MENRVSKKKIMYAVFTVFIMLAAALPFLAMPFYESSAADAEQRELAEFPALIDEDGFNGNIGKDIEEWFQDRFAFRSELVNAGSEIMLGAFASSSEDSVICGKDGWLFYAETLESYCGTKKMSAAELGRLATVIRLEQQFCTDRGVAYVFAAAPNKNSVYPEYMQPQYICTESETDLEKLNFLLLDSGVNVADLKSALLAEKDKGLLYYYADSHWNLAGATVAYRAIMERAKVQNEFYYDSYTDAVYESAEREGDLLKMVLPLDCVVKENSVKSNIPCNYKYAGRFKTLDDMSIKTQNKSANEKNGELLMFRDSFGRALISLFSEQFASATYVRTTPFNLYGNISGKRLVVREIVERNLDTLLERAPVATAPVTAGGVIMSSRAVNVSDASVIVSEASMAGKLTHVYGFIEQENGGNDNYRVFACVDGEYYEGFPVYESLLCEEYGDCGADRAGFSFYFESDVLAEGESVEIYYAAK